MRRQDRPTAFQSSYAEPETLARPAGYARAPVVDVDVDVDVDDARPRPKRVARPEALLGLTLLASDAAMFATAVGIESTYWTGGALITDLMWSAAFGLLALAVFTLRRAYAPRISLNLIGDLGAVVGVTAAAAMAIASTRALLGAEEIAGAQMARHWLLATALVAVGRAGILGAERRARRRGEGTLPTLIVGAGRVGMLTARRLLDDPARGLRPIGFLDKEPLESEGGVVPLPVLGASWDLEHVIEEHAVRHVIVTFSTAPYAVLLWIVRRCRDLGLSVSVVPRLFEVEGDRVSVERLGGLPLVLTQHRNPRGWHFRIKYGFERILAAAGLVLALPLLLVTMAAVHLTMGRPVLFRQRRIGSDGREFNMLKLRTMKGSPDEDGEADLDWALDYLEADANGERPSSSDSLATHEGMPVIERLDDDRRTALGRLLRHFSLDELPQLWNVVRGDMSLVGPRPERVVYARRFEQSVYRYGDRHRVKSGITGWAQVNGLRGRTSLFDRVEWDNYYIENWSPWLDIRIVLMTIACVLRGQHEERSR